MLRAREENFGGRRRGAGERGSSTVIESSCLQVERVARCATPRTRGRIGGGSGGASNAVRVEWAARCATSWTRGGTGGGSGGASDVVRVSDDRRFRDSR